jgi:hypothetical protein
MDTAATLRQLEATYAAAKQAEACHKQADAADARSRRVTEAAARHLDAARLHALVTAMRHAAEAGESRYLALQFPAEVCTDGGRRINSAQEDWPESLQGEAASLYRFWQAELRPAGFKLAAEVLNFPNGMPVMSDLPSFGDRPRRPAGRQVGNPDFSASRLWACSHRLTLCLGLRSIAIGAAVVNAAPPAREITPSRYYTWVLTSGQPTRCGGGCAETGRQGTQVRCRSKSSFTSDRMQRLN